MRRLIVNVCFKRHGGIPDTNRQRPQRAFPPAPPLSGNLRVWAAPRGARLPLRWGSVAATRFPECPFPRARSFRLRDSGAVAPSAIRICAPNPLPRRGPKPRDSGERKDHGPTILFRQVERLEGRRGDDLIKGFDAFGNNGAQKRTRTSTPFRAPPPEDGASTNSAIWARGRARPLRGWAGPCQPVRDGPIAFSVTERDLTTAVRGLLRSARRRGEADPAKIERLTACKAAGGS